MSILSSTRNLFISAVLDLIESAFHCRILMELGASRGLMLYSRRLLVGLGVGEGGVGEGGLHVLSLQDEQYQDQF